MRLPVFLLLSLTLFAAPSRVPRAELREAENRFDTVIQKRWVDDQRVLLGTSRAFYVDGYGVIVTAEINLLTGPSVTPFSLPISPEMIAQHRAKKLERLAHMKDLLASTAQQAKSWFPELRDDEHIAVGVQMYRYVWEDATGLPRQLLSQTTKRNDARVQVQEN